MNNLEDRIDKAADILKDVRSVVVSTGAGMSKESGIPTFRDAPNALWENYNPEDLASPQGFLKNPSLVWRWYQDRQKMIAAAEPNPGHKAIAELEELYDDFVVITQNIDDLHRKAGSRSIIEIHGNIFRYKCFDNEHPLKELPKDDRVPPRCSCGSMIRPDVVWFGEPLPQDGIKLAYEVLYRCDAILVVGTSGIVVPAAYFPSIAKNEGAKVIEVNPEMSQITQDADVFLQGPAGEVLPRVVEKIRSLKQ
jgi:NAD-dependent deacetylase